MEPSSPYCFRNPPGSPLGTATTLDFLRFLHSRLTNDDRTIVIPPGHVLSAQDAAHSWTQTPGDKLQWLGHSAFRWRIGGVTLLSDPLLTDRASPVSWAGPKRFVSSPLRPEEAHCQIVLLTHCHYDHLDLRTLRSLPNKQDIHFIVPLGLTPLIRRAGLHQVTELGWHESTTLHGLTITLVPAVHFAARTLWDRNRTLWGGYAVRHQNLNIYLSGDTTYHPSLFREIGLRHGPFDHALVPIGAYEPRDIMIEHHATPEEGAAIGRDLRAETLIAHHWGAIRLTTEDPFEPPARFLTAARTAGFAEQKAWIMKVGETRPLLTNH